MKCRRVAQLKCTARNLIGVVVALAALQAPAAMWNAKNPPSRSPEAGPSVELSRDEFIVEEKESGVSRDIYGQLMELSYRVIIKNRLTGATRETTRWVRYETQRIFDLNVRNNSVQAEAQSLGIQIETSDSDGRVVAWNVPMTKRQLQEYASLETRAAVLEELIRAKNQAALVEDLNRTTELQTIPEARERIEALQKILESRPALALVDSQKRANLVTNTIRCQRGHPGRFVLWCHSSICSTCAVSNR
ncbi:MAG: hypothetical protein ACK5Y2_10685 [Bdellovibrionales bacterium]